MTWTSPSGSISLMSDAEQLDEVADVSEARLREAALRRLKKRRDFHGHVFAYVVVNVAVWAISGDRSDGWHPWPLWVTIGWGVGVVQRLGRLWAAPDHRSRCPPRDGARATGTLTHGSFPPWSHERAGARNDSRPW